MLEIKIKNLEKGNNPFNQIALKDAFEMFTNNQQLEYCEDKKINFLLGCENQFIAMLHSAFSEHVPLVLNPDDIWTVILQSFAIHINQNAEKFRDVLVDFEGEKIIRVRDDSFRIGKNNNWMKVFEMFSNSLKNNIKDTELHSVIVSNYSTTTELNKAIFEISMANTMQKYFDYKFATMCGIPAIYLDGTKEDWLKIIKNLDYISSFGLSVWTNEIINILNHFVTAYDGNIDKTFWESIYKYRSFSGGDEVDGWITAFFLYKSNIETGKFNTKINDYDYINQTFKIKDFNITPSDKEYRFSKAPGTWDTTEFPSSVNFTDFIWEYFDKVFPMQITAGIVGFEETEKGLKPVSSYAISYKDNIKNENLNMEENDKLKTEIVCVLDRSGSMSSILDDAIGGFNAFLNEQKEIEDSDAYLTVALFDDKYAILHEHVAIKDVPEIDPNSFVPRGMTALNDAIGKTINSLKERLNKLPIDEKPNKVIFTILTDGNENASKEYSSDAIKQLIKEQEANDWNFIYLAANQNAFATSDSYGISRGNTLNFATTDGDLNSGAEQYKWATRSFAAMPADQPTFSGTQKGDIKDVYANFSQKLTKLRKGDVDYTDDFFLDINDTAD